MRLVTLHHIQKITDLNVKIHKTVRKQRNFYNLGGKERWGRDFSNLGINIKSTSNRIIIVKLSVLQGTNKKVKRAERIGENNCKSYIK